MKTKGFWVIKTSAGGYWCSGNFDPQLRKAHVYTWKEKAEESSAYLRLLMFLPAILIPACASFSPEFHMMYSAHKLNK